MMRRLVILTMAALLTIPVFSQSDVAVSIDSLTHSLDLENLRKISFKDGSVVATYSDGSVRSHKLSESEKLQFSIEDRHEESITDGEGTYTIYDLSGRPVGTHTDKSCDKPFDLNDLTSGIYLLKTGNRTIKIVK